MRDTPTRRRILAALGATGAAGFAGCIGGSTPTANGQGGGEDGDTDSNGTGDSPTAQPQLPAPVSGDPDADVTLAVYEDFACPHCQAYNATGYPELAAAFVDPGRVRYEHRDLPIPVLDPESFEAANAARAVQDRHSDEAFWAYADALFSNQDALGSETPGLYATVAADLGYEGEPVRADAVDQVYADTVAGDRQRGVDAGVEGTPGFVVDGEVVASGFGDSTVGTVQAAVEERL
ncbi:MAG: protein-disulfide isomerase [Natronomonas sp.]|jgi:protein-disulfide isomerase